MITGRPRERPAAARETTVAMNGRRATTGRRVTTGRPARVGRHARNDRSMDGRRATTGRADPAIDGRPRSAIGHPATARVVHGRTARKARGAIGRRHRAAGVRRRRKGIGHADPSRAIARAADRDRTAGTAGPRDLAIAATAGRRRRRPAMIAHVVLFAPKPDLPDVRSRAVLEGLTAAAADIPSNRRFRVGRRVSHGLPGYEQAMPVDFEYVVMIEFDDEAGLRAYLATPLARRRRQTLHDVVSRGARLRLRDRGGLGREAVDRASTGVRRIGLRDWTGEEEALDRVPDFGDRAR